MFSTGCTPCSARFVTCIKALILYTLWCQFTLCKVNVKSLHSTFTAELGIFHRVFSATLMTEFWHLFSCTAFPLTTRTKLTINLLCSASWGDWCVVNCRWRAVTVNTKLIKQCRARVSHCNMSGSEICICQSVTQDTWKNIQSSSIYHYANKLSFYAVADSTKHLKILNTFPDM